MEYNFDEIIDRRHTNALNTDGFRGYIFHAGPEKVFPFADDEFVRMWVADMEFATPKPILDAIRRRLDRRILGYSSIYDSSYYDVFSGWCNRMYDWEFPKEELTYSSGVIPALYQLVELLVKGDEKILVNTPAYGFFEHAAQYSDREMTCSPLIFEKGTWSLDLADMEKRAQDPKTTLLIWCNPHNPTGRAWTERELLEIARIVKENDLWVISDEIHCDLLRSGGKHIPLAKVMEGYDKLITCMSASKTFNMAGLMFSDIIIRDKALRDAFIGRDKTAGFLNPLSIAAHMAAYKECRGWLMALRKYLDGNFRFVAEALQEGLPDISFTIPDATYLAWVDMNPYLAHVENIPELFANEAGVLLEGGDDLFVGNAKGFIRLNLAMPRSIIREGMKRIIETAKKHSGKE